MVGTVGVTVGGWWARGWWFWCKWNLVSVIVVVERVFLVTVEETVAAVGYIYPRLGLIRSWTAVSSGEEKSGEEECTYHLVLHVVSGVGLGQPDT